MLKIQQRYPLALGFLSIFVITDTLLLWSIYYANPIGMAFLSWSAAFVLFLLWVQSSLVTSLRVHPEKKGNVSLRSLVSIWLLQPPLQPGFTETLWDAFDLQNHLRKKYVGLAYFCSSITKHDQPHFFFFLTNHILMATEGIKSFPLVAITFAGLAILR